MKILNDKVEEKKKLGKRIGTMKSLKEHPDYTCSDCNAAISQESSIGLGGCWGCYEKRRNEDRLNERK